MQDYFGFLCVCVCACVRAVRACVRACVRAYVYIYIYMQGMKVAKSYTNIFIIMEVMAFY